jgi:uncharacterized protein
MFVRRLDRRLTHDLTLRLHHIALQFQSEYPAPCLDTLNAFSAGDLPTVLSNLADGVTWKFFGTHRFSGTFRGKDELSKGLFEVVGSVLKAGIAVQVNTLTVDGGRVVVEAKGRAESNSGLEYNNDYCLVFELADGKIRPCLNTRRNSVR